jgi:hypothetical protein
MEVKPLGPEEAPIVLNPPSPYFGLVTGYSSPSSVGDMNPMNGMPPVIDAMKNPIILYVLQYIIYSATLTLLEAVKATFVL